MTENEIAKAEFDMRAAACRHVSCAMLALGSGLYAECEEHLREALKHVFIAESASEMRGRRDVGGELRPALDGPVIAEKWEAVDRFGR